jgi:hypothetical protein
VPFSFVISVIFVVKSFIAFRVGQGPGRPTHHVTINWYEKSPKHVFYMECCIQIRGAARNAFTVCGSGAATGNQRWSMEQNNDI